MPSPRYIVRLPPALDALVQEHIRASETPFAVLMQEALAAYLADTPPPGTLTRADSTDSVQELQGQLAALTTRVEALEQRQPTRPTAPTRADTPQVRTPGGQYKLTPRQVRTLRAKRQRGVPIQKLMQEYGVSRATLFRYFA